MSIFQRSIHIRDCDVAVNRALRPSCLFSMLQEASIDHTEQLGAGRSRTLDRGYLWVIARQHVKISRLPLYGEEVVLESWPGEMLHVLFPRYYRMLDRNGQCLLSASAIWSLIDAENRSLVFPDSAGIKVPGIVTGPTNYILTQMTAWDESFDVALKAAQAKGFAELHPEADIEGHDARRKIAILSTMAYGKHVSYQNVVTEGITDIDTTDIEYAKAQGLKIKLLASSRKTEHGIWAMVAPMLVSSENMLYNVEGVLNAIYVHGNALGDAIFYGSGAGSLPTASAVAGDIITIARSLDRTLPSDWTGEELELMPTDDIEHAFFVRFAGSEEEAKAVFGDIEPIRLDNVDDEFGFMTAVMTEKAFRECSEKAGKVKKSIRRA